MVFNQHPHSGFALHRDQMMMTGIWVINGRTLMRMQSCIGLSPRLTFLPPRHKIGSKLKKMDASFFSQFSGWDDSHSFSRYMFKSVVIRLLNLPLIFSFVVICLLNPSLICLFHWPVLLLILYCILRYCYLRPMVLSIQYWYSALNSFFLDHCHHPTASGSVFVDYGLLVMETGFLKEHDCATQRT